MSLYDIMRVLVLLTVNRSFMRVLVDLTVNISSWYGVGLLVFKMKTFILKSFIIVGLLYKVLKSLGFIHPIYVLATSTLLTLFLLYLSRVLGFGKAYSGKIVQVESDQGYEARCMKMLYSLQWHLGYNQRIIGQAKSILKSIPLVCSRRVGLSLQMESHQDPLFMQLIKLNSLESQFSRAQWYRVQEMIQEEDFNSVRMRFRPEYRLYQELLDLSYTSLNYLKIRLEPLLRANERGYNSLEDLSPRVRAEILSSRCRALEHELRTLDTMLLAHLPTRTFDPEVIRGYSKEHIQILSRNPDIDSFKKRQEVTYTELETLAIRHYRDSLGPESYKPHRYALVQSILSGEIEKYREEVDTYNFELLSRKGKIPRRVSLDWLSTKDSP